MLVSLKVFHHDMSHGSVWEVMVLFLICICGMNFPFTKRRACFYLEVVNFLIQSIQSHIVCPHIINKYEQKTKQKKQISLTFVLGTYHLLYALFNLCL